MLSKSQNPDYAAQSILARRDHSIFEIKSKMKRKGFTTQQINETINKFKKANLLNDKKFARQYAQQIIQNKPVGPHFIKHKLKQKGIKENFAQEALNNIFVDDLEEKMAQEAVRKWQILHPQHRSDKARLARFLISRGFSYPVIEKTL